VDGERDLGDLVKRARPKIAKNLMTLSVERGDADGDAAIGLRRR